MDLIIRPKPKMELSRLFASKKSSHLFERALSNRMLRNARFVPWVDLRSMLHAGSVVADTGSVEGASSFEACSR